MRHIKVTLVSKEAPGALNEVAPSSRTLGVRLRIRPRASRADEIDERQGILQIGVRPSRTSCHIGRPRKLDAGALTPARLGSCIVTSIVIVADKVSFAPSREPSFGNIRNSIVSWDHRMSEGTMLAEPG